MAVRRTYNHRLMEGDSESMSSYFLQSYTNPLRTGLGPKLVVPNLDSCELVQSEPKPHDVSRLPLSNTTDNKNKNTHPPVNTNNTPKQHTEPRHPPPRSEPTPTGGESLGTLAARDGLHWPSTLLASQTATAVRILDQSMIGCTPNESVAPVPNRWWPRSNRPASSAVVFGWPSSSIRCFSSPHRKSMGWSNCSLGGNII